MTIYLRKRYPNSFSIHWPRSQWQSMTALGCWHCEKRRLYLQCWICQRCKTGLECSLECQHSVHLHMICRCWRYVECKGLTWSVLVERVYLWERERVFKGLEVCYDSQTSPLLPGYVSICVSCLVTGICMPAQTHTNTHSQFLKIHTSWPLT